jgi:hypothetical protein
MQNLLFCLEEYAGRNETEDVWPGIVIGDPTALGAAVGDLLLGYTCRFAELALRNSYRLRPPGLHAVWMDVSAFSGSPPRRDKDNT